MGLAAELKQILCLPLERFEEARLAAGCQSWTLPRHVGIILDGNRRFARQTGCSSVLEGHARGAEKLREVLRWFYDIGISTVTIWIFSIDNFQREAAEVQGLLQLIEQKTREMTRGEDIQRYRARVRYIGRTNLLPEGLRDAIREAEESSREYDGHFLNVAIAYGGREEITDALERFLEANAGNGTTRDALLEKLREEGLGDYLYTAGQPDPDLIIRTSGEVRLSGFLLWQSAYAEYYFCQSFWPQFRRLDLLRALHAYHRRQRRYGK